PRALLGTGHLLPAAGRVGRLSCGTRRAPRARAVPDPACRASGRGGDRALVADHRRELPRMINSPHPSTEDDLKRLDTRLGPIGYRVCGDGPVLVFFAGAFANGDLWSDVVALLQDRYRCI